MADTAITPTTGSLAFTGKESYFVNSGDSKLVFTGNAPSLLYAALVIPVPTGSLTFDEKTPRRRTGIDFTGYSPTLMFSGTVSPTTGSIEFDGKQTFPLTTTPTNTLVLPETAELTFTGTSSAVIVQKISPATAELALAGYSPNTLVSGVTTPKYPFFGILEFTGYAPTIGIAHSGTSITNPWATTDVPTNYQIDDRTGFKIKVKDPMVEEYTGHRVRPESLDKRSEQEFIRSRPENQKGPTRPEPVGNERHIDELYPDGVDADTDLD